MKIKPTRPWLRPGRDRPHRPAWYRTRRDLPSAKAGEIDAIDCAIALGLETNAFQFDVFTRAARVDRKPGEPAAKEVSKIIDTCRRWLSVLESPRPPRFIRWRTAGTPAPAPDPDVFEVELPVLDRGAPPSSGRDSASEFVSACGIDVDQVRRSHRPRATAVAEELAGREQELRELRQGLEEIAVSEAIAWTDLQFASLGDVSTATFGELQEKIAQVQREKWTRLERYRRALLGIELEESEGDS